MPPKKHIIIIGVLCVIALGLGYWVGMPKEEGSGGGGKKEPEFLKQGLVAYYPFHGNAKDESGNGNDGEVHGATLAEDRKGQATSAYLFDGEDDLIEIPPSRSINAMRSLSIAFWIKANKAQNPKGKWGYTGLVTRWSFEDSSRVCAFGIWIKAEEIAICVWPIVQANQFMPFEKEVWRHIVYTHDVSDASIYVDGEQKSRRQHPINLRESSIPLIIGADNESSQGKHRFFSGQLDDIRIYNRALSEAEVKELYEFEKAP